MVVVDRDRGRSCLVSGCTIVAVFGCCSAGLQAWFLLVGPLWQIGAPLVTAYELNTLQRSAAALQIETLQRSEVENIATLNQYLQNSAERPGWAVYIEAARADLTATRTALVEVVGGSTVEVRAGWLSVAVIIIQIVALILLQIAGSRRVACFALQFYDRATGSGWSSG